MPTSKSQDITSPKMDMFCTYMFTIGSESFGNGTESARKAGYDSKGGSDNVLAATASRLLRNVKVIARKEQIQAKTSAKMEHNREIAIQELNEARDIALKQLNPAAMISATREKDAISNLHKATIVNEQPVSAITGDEQKQIEKLARAAKVKLA